METVEPQKPGNSPNPGPEGETRKRVAKKRKVQSPKQGSAE